ncbi:MAG: rRNA maturation RNase YbeY [Planctomycetota bacterium]
MTTPTHTDQTARAADGDTPDPDGPDRPPSAGPAISVLGRADSSETPELPGLARKLATALATRQGSVRVRIVGDDAMADAHQRYKDIEGTTDVLTFDLAGDPSAPLDADVLVCIDEAARQAQARGIPIEHELLLYITHAVLHCSGYNDDTDEAAAAMHAREDELLTAIGIGPVYGTNKAEPAS